jgi:hypothetical protein
MMTPSQQQLWRKCATTAAAAPHRGNQPCCCSSEATLTNRHRHAQQHQQHARLPGAVDTGVVAIGEKETGIVPCQIGEPAGQGGGWAAAAAGEGGEGEGNEGHEPFVAPVHPRKLMKRGQGLSAGAIDVLYSDIQAMRSIIGDACGCTCHESSSGSCESPVSVTHPPQPRRSISLCFQE